MLSERDLLQYLKYHLAPWKGMLNSWKKIPDHARPKTYLPDGSGPEKLFKGLVKADLRNNGNPIRRWPDNWKDMRIDELSGILARV